MGFSKTIKEFFKSVFKNKAGAALPMIMFVGGLVAAGGYLLSQSGQMITLSGKTNSERTIVNNVIQDIETALASRSTCTAAMGTFNQIGEYTRNIQIGQGGGVDITVTWPNGGIAALPVVPNGFFPAGDPLTPVRRLILTFTINNDVRGARNIQHDLYVQEFTTEVDIGVTEDSCMAFQLTGAENSVDLFCERIGGTLNNDGTCNLDAAGADVLLNQPFNFRARVRELACSLIGGAMDGANNCDVVNIPAGHLHSEQFFPDNPGDNILIDDSGDLRTNYTNFNCPIDSVANGFNEDGTLSCVAIDCNEAFTNSNIPVYSNYVFDGSSGNRQCRCQRDFKFGRNIHNVTLDAPVDGTRYKVAGGDPAAQMHAMISPWLRPSDYNGTALSNNDGTVGCNDEDPYACRDYDWNDGCALGTTCKILRGRYPGCGVTTTSEQKVIINGCNDICAVGPGCDNNLNTPRTDGCVVENDPLPPTITCSGATVAGSCTVPDAGAGSSGVAGTCAGGTTGTCSVDCSATGTWGTPNTTSCVSATSECAGLADTTEYNNSTTCKTGPGPDANYYSCEIRGTKYCRLGRACNRSTLSVPNAIVSSSSGYDVAGQAYGGTVACNDSSPAPSVVCNGSTGNYDITGSCGGGVTCGSGAVSWSSGSCQGNIPSIYSQGSVVNVSNTLAGRTGDADFICQASGNWAVDSGDPQTCNVNPCTNSSLSVANANLSTTSGTTANGSSYSGTITCNSGYTGSPSASCSSGSWSVSGSCSSGGADYCGIQTYDSGGNPIFNHVTASLFPGDSHYVSNDDQTAYSVTCQENGDVNCFYTSGGGGRTYTCSATSSCDTYNNKAVSGADYNACLTNSNSEVSSCEAVSGCTGTLLGSDDCTGDWTGTIGCFSDATEYSGTGCTSCPNGSTLNGSVRSCNAPAGKTIVSPSSRNICRCTGFSCGGPMDLPWSMTVR